MNSVSRSSLETVGGGFFDAGIIFGHRGVYAFVDVGTVFNLPFLGSLRFGPNERYVYRVV